MSPCVEQAVSATDMSTAYKVMAGLYSLLLPAAVCAVVIAVGARWRLAVKSGRKPSRHWCFQQVVRWLTWGVYAVLAITLTMLTGGSVQDALTIIGACSIAIACLSVADTQFAFDASPDARTPCQWMIHRGGDVLVKIGLALVVPSFGELVVGLTKYERTDIQLLLLVGAGFICHEVWSRYFQLDVPVHEQ